MSAELGPRWSIGRYRVLKRLSVGGMAEVFLALAAGPGEFRKFVTLKRILPDLQEDEDFVRMFLEEARISAALSHANIAQVFDLRADDDELYLAMEYVAGQDLLRILRATAKLKLSIPLGFACMVVRDTANALHYAHTFVDTSGQRAPIIHRDIAPKNVMVTYSGSVKVIDFGIAKMKYESQVPRSTSIKGSSGYASPEQINGMPADGRSDIFSLGAVMYELLTGIRAFTTRSPGLTVPEPQQVVPPHLMNPRVPPELSAVVMQAIEFDPDKRFASGKDIARAVEAAAPEIFDEERAANLMQVVFAEGIETIRKVLRSADAPPDELQAALARLRPADASREAAAETLRTLVDAPPSEVHDVHTLQSGPRPRVLAVDDSFASLQVLKAQLGRAGFEVIGASVPAEALTLLDTTKPDAIILDVVMPELSGFDVCRRIRERDAFRSTPILFLSAACSLEERIRCLEVGGDDFIRKPYAAAELALRVRSHLARVAVLHDPKA